MNNHEQKVELLRKVDIFSPLQEYELDIIAKHSSFRKVKKSEIIFGPDSDAKKLFVIKSGSVGVIAIRNKEQVELAQLLPGESFGQLDLLGGSKRTATAFAEIDSELLLFPKGDMPLQDLIEKHPHISALLFLRIITIIADRTHHVHVMLKEKNEWLHNLRRTLHTDKLTGLFNQIYLQEEITSSLKSNDKNTALIMIKPDNFKTINDTYGHEIGDKALQLMAILLQASLNENDVAIRYHGDEFAAFLPGSDKDHAIKTAKEINDNFKWMKLKRLLNGDDIIIKLSMGIALFPEESPNGTSLIGAAYKKMYEARNGGGNRIKI